ncbi:MAG: glycosyltransferase family 4 protein [Flavobacteriaceae bacterium]|nr:glycosyltransferase family 4 protein [Flavobacteriaceae bacterium]
MLFITSEFPPQPGGIGEHAYQLASFLSQKGKKVTVLTDRRSLDGKEEAVFDTALPFTVKRIKRTSFLSFTYINRCLKALSLLNKHQIILVSGKFSLWMVSLLRKFTSKKIIAIIHGTEVLLPKKRQRKFTEKCLLQCDAVIAVSKFTASLVAHLPLKKLVIIPNGIVIPQNPKIHPKSKTDSLQLITVGNLTQRKGQHHVIQVLPMLKKTLPEVHYHMVGLPTDMEKLQQLAEDLEVSQRVTFHGRVSAMEKDQLLDASALFMMLSENTDEGDVEGFGIAILEANTRGLPAIGALGCGIEDAIENGFSGELVDSKNPESIVDAVHKIRSNYEVYSKNAVEWSLRFNWNNIVERYLLLMDDN